MNKQQEKTLPYWWNFAKNLPDGYELKVGLKMVHNEFFGLCMAEEIEIKPKHKRQS